MSPMNPRLLRPTASGATHPEARDWATRVTANGGTVSSTTLAAVSKFCAAIDAAGIRDKFYRLNLFCGEGLTAALVPLYLAESSNATARGNSTDTNNGPFVSDDYNNTGVLSGLKGNGTSKFLNTGILGNSLTANNAHFGVGLRATQTGAAAFRAVIGVFNGSTAVLGVDVRRNDTNRCALFGAAGNSAAGDQVQSSSLAVGDLVAAWPTLYRDGSASGTDATTSINYPSAHNLYVFALNNSNTSTINYTDSRVNWYSIGLTMTAAQALSFYNAVAAFNTALSRT
jgi:hypothetical protein